MFVIVQILSVLVFCVAALLQNIEEHQLSRAAARFAGTNGFTKEEAQSRIEGWGYTHVTNLKRDQNGLWRGDAVLDGTPHKVTLNFQGQVR